MWHVWVCGKQFKTTVIHHCFVGLLSKPNSHAQTYPGESSPGHCAFLLNQMACMLVLALFAFRFVYCSSLLFSYSGGEPLQAMVSHVPWQLVHVGFGQQADKAGDFRQTVKEKAGYFSSLFSTSSPFTPFHSSPLPLVPSHPQLGWQLISKARCCCAPRDQCTLLTKDSYLPGFNSQVRFCGYRFSLEHCNVDCWSSFWGHIL